MTFDPEKNEHLSKRKLVSAPTGMPPRTGSAEPPPLSRAEAEGEAEAVRRMKELQRYRVVLCCRTKPAED
jgi:hypothetical protein